MESYVGLKQIEAQPISLGNYNKYRGWNIPDNKDPNKEGYLVKYPDGYVSWSPKEIFEDAYKKSGHFSFEMALFLLKLGFKVARKGWNGKGMHVTKEFLFTFENVPVANEGLLLFNVNGKYNTWVPSITDLFADDWQIVE